MADTADTETIDTKALTQDPIRHATVRAVATAASICGAEQETVVRPQTTGTGDDDGIGAGTMDRRGIADAEAIGTETLMRESIRRIAVRAAAAASGRVRWRVRAGTVIDGNH